MNKLLPLLLLACLCFLPACAATPAQAASGPINATCPLSGHAVDPDVDTVTWKGEAIGFCCPKCVGKWNGLADEQKDKAVARFHTQS